MIYDVQIVGMSIISALIVILLLVAITRSSVREKALGWIDNLIPPLIEFLKKLRKDKTDLNGQQ